MKMNVSPNAEAWIDPSRLERIRVKAPPAPMITPNSFRNVMRSLINTAEITKTMMGVAVIMMLALIGEVCINP